MPDRADDSLTTLRFTGAAGLAKLSVQALAGTEALDQPFLYRLECQSADPGLDLETALGQHATVTLVGGGVERVLDGLCARIGQWPGDSNAARYTLELRPWLWWLTLATDHRIFQAKSVVEIVEAVFAAHGYADYKLSLTASYAARDYCVQFGESDFAFVSRLLEEEGIFYFFEHEVGRHVLVLADANSAFAACNGGVAIDFAPPQVGARVAAIRGGQLGHQAVSRGYRATDFQFTTPKTSLYAQADAGASAPAVYDYPGGYLAKAAGETLTKQRVDGLRTGARELAGEGDVRTLAAGGSFKLAGHERDDANTDWLLREVSHDASHQHYHNRFLALPLASAYRPRRTTPRPRLHSTQTAIVVGKSGEEIWTDEYGRVKVQFHWDRVGKNDEHSSCWVRVAQMWSGNGWGAQFIPRIGQEVVISFLDGDPDRPLVTGCVYNGANPLPYALPAEQTKSALKSQSLQGGGGFNELRFEDKKDAEQLYLRAQKDMKTEILHDALRTVGNDDTVQVKQNQTIEVQEGNQKLTVVKGNRETQISTGDDTLAVKGKRSVTIDGNEVRVNKGDLTHTIDGNYSLTVQGNLTIEVSGAVKITAGTEFSNEAAAALTNKAGTALTNKAGTTLTNDAGLSLVSKAAASQTVDGGGMLTLKGGLVKIN